MKLYELFKKCDYSDDPFPHWTSDAFFPDSIAESLFRVGLCLPSGSNLSEEDLLRVVNGVRGVFLGKAG